MPNGPHRHGQPERKCGAMAAPAHRILVASNTRRGILRRPGQAARAMVILPFASPAWTEAQLRMVPVLISDQAVVVGGDHQLQLEVKEGKNNFEMVSNDVCNDVLVLVL